MTLVSKRDASADSLLTLRFMLAARQRELQGMRALAQTCAFVIEAGQLVHALQKERGQASLQLSRATPFWAEWRAQGDLALGAEQQLRARLAMALNEDPLSPCKTRWLHAVAHALHGLDGLTAFRGRLAAGHVPAEQAIAGYGRVIGSLLGAVIEALEGPADPQITQLLVALLNFMQAKELCGQERAQGVAGFARGHFGAEHQALLVNLAQAQERSFGLFAQHAPTVLRSAWQDLQLDELALHRLRQIATAPGATPDASLAQLWFDVCTARIDALRGLEQALAVELAARCEARVAETSQALAALADATEAPRGQCGAGDGGLGAPTFFDQPLVYTLVGRPMDAAVTGDAVGDAMARSVLDVLLAQGARLHEADLALAQAQQAQQERRQVEQAKWWLVSRYQLSESEAHERLLRTAMNAGLALQEVAQQVLAERDQA